MRTNVVLTIASAEPLLSDLLSVTVTSAVPSVSCTLRSDDTEARHCLHEQATARERLEAGSCWPAKLDVLNLTAEFRHSIETRKQIHACLDPSGTVQRTKHLWKGESEGDTRIHDSSDGSPLTIEIGSDSQFSRTLDYWRLDPGPLAPN
jgi:hypothetical protein